MSLSSRLQINIIAATLILIGSSLTIYKASFMGFPLFPGESREVWTIESKISFAPAGGPVNVELTLPQQDTGWLTLDEHFASSGFDFSVQTSSVPGQDKERANSGDARRVAVWSRQGLERSSTLYYKLQSSQESVVEAKDLPGIDSAPRREVDFEPDQRAAIERVVERIRKVATDNAGFAAELMRLMLLEQQDRDLSFLLAGDMFQKQRLSEARARVQVVLDVLDFADIPARLLRGIYLEDNRRRQSLSALVEVYDGRIWRAFDPVTGEPGIPENFFLWQRGGDAILDVIGGEKSRIEFALVRNTLPAKTVLMMEGEHEGRPLIDFSIYSLPVEQQGMFKGILLIPVGALVVVLLRVFVGIRTSGTFMPILIALAFIQTTLLTGMAIFLTVVGAGLWIRNYLSHLNLLLVARVTGVVILVILLMAVFSIVSYKLGLDQALTVTFFPTIIMAWTIERMSILWEEEGAQEVFVQGGGSLLAAVLAFLLMSNRWVAHLTFNFPELLLAVLGLVLLLGKYNGYRLSELYRFRYLHEQEPGPGHRQ